MDNLNDSLEGNSPGFLKIHFLLSGIGVIALAFHFSWAIFKAFHINQYPPDFYIWTRNYFYPTKPQNLLFYFLGSFFLFAYYSLASLVVYSGKVSDRSLRAWLAERKIPSASYFLLILIVNILALFSCRIHSKHLSDVFMLGWIVALTCPFLFQLWDERNALDEAASSPRVHRVVWALLFLLGVQFFWLIWPVWIGPLKMINEFMDIPEETILNGKFVDNTNYINSHRLLGLIKYSPDLDRGQDPNPPPGSFLKIPLSPSLEEFLSQIGVRRYCYYDFSRGILVFTRPMTRDEFRVLQMIVPVSEESKLLSIYLSINNKWKRSKRHLFSEKEAGFIRRNSFEIYSQLAGLWMLHHHSFIVLPINEYALGRSINKINIQYGFLNIALTEFLMRHFGGITYQNYFHVWYSYWPVYYFLFFLAAVLIFRNPFYVFCLACLTLASLNFTNAPHPVMFSGPGANPIRRFLDIPVLILFYFFIQKKNKLFFYGAILLSLLAFANNKEFGLALYAALVAAFLIEQVLEWGRVFFLDVIILVLTLPALVWIFRLPSGKNELFSYYLHGLPNAPMPMIRLLIILASFLSFYCVSIIYWRKLPSIKYVVLFLFFYIQAYFLYCVWGASNLHFLTAAPIVSFCALMGVKVLLDLNQKKFQRNALLGCLAMVCLFFVYLPSLADQCLSVWGYNQIFKTHKTYYWNLPRAKFVSTMDPKYFENSISVIDRHSQGQNGVFIISQYDDIIPFLSSKYSRMPYPELPWFLSTPKELNNCIATIQKNKPPFLFVDTDIERSLDWEIEYPWMPDSPASLWRVERLSNLKKIFDAVKADYVPVDRGLLITAYERKN